MNRPYNLTDVVETLEQGILDAKQDLESLTLSKVEWERAHAKQIALRQKLNVVKRMIGHNAEFETEN